MAEAAETGSLRSFRCFGAPRSTPTIRGNRVGIVEDNDHRWDISTRTHTRVRPYTMLAVTTMDTTMIIADRYASARVVAELGEERALFVALVLNERFNAAPSASFWCESQCNNRS
jgi:hypothetical protein